MSEIKERKYIAFLEPYRDAYFALEKPEDKVLLIDLILQGGFYGIMPDPADLPPIVRAVWAGLQKYVSDGYRKYLIGCKGGAPSEKMKGNQNARKDKIEPNSEFDISTHIADNTLSVRPQKISTTLKKNSPPTAEDVRTVIASKKGKYDYLIPYVDDFISYYTKQKWALDSGEPMHDWWRTFQAYPYKQT